LRVSPAASSPDALANPSFSSLHRGASPVVLLSPREAQAPIRPGSQPAKDRHRQRANVRQPRAASVHQAGGRAARQRDRSSRHDAASTTSLRRRVRTGKPGGRPAYGSRLFRRVNPGIWPTSCPSSSEGRAIRISRSRMRCWSCSVRQPATARSLPRSASAARASRSRAPQRLLTPASGDSVPGFPGRIATALAKQLGVRWSSTG